MASVSLKNLTKRFDGGNPALLELSLEVRDGEFLVLLGPTGCGKTTTLRCIAGLEHPDEGTITIDGEAVTSAAGRVFLPPEARNVGMVFQSYAVWPHMTVAQNVAYPLEVRRLPRREIAERVGRVLELVGLIRFRDQSATRLSGGQQQRVALARALVYNPRVLLFDEPLSNLDAKLREQLRVEIVRLQREVGITSIYVTHDQAEAMVISDQVIVMNHGRIEQQGDARTIYTRPANRFVAEFIGLANLLPAAVTAAPSSTGFLCAEVALGGDRTAALRVAAAGRQAPPGAKVLLSIRPEDVQVGPPGSGGGENRIEGTVTNAMFMGNYVDYHVEAGDVRFRIQASPRAPFRPGDQVSLTLPPDACVCIPDDPSAR